jgi:glycosyltransferase involved in cell wall biosynthesis
MPVLEALTVGVPVVAADRGALPEVVGDAGRLVPPDDPDGIAAALSDLLTDPGQRDRLRAAGWVQARRFRWEDAARSVREAWGLAIEARARRG